MGKYLLVSRIFKVRSERVNRKGKTAGLQGKGMLLVLLLSLSVVDGGCGRGPAPLPSSSRWVLPQE
jgi:hypothetical protein